MKSHCWSIDTPAHYGWSVVCREKPLFSSLPLPIDLFTGSSPSYYLKSISATLAQSIFHSSFPCWAVVSGEDIWTSADTCSNNPKKWISILCKSCSTKPATWYMSVLVCVFCIAFDISMKFCDDSPYYIIKQLVYAAKTFANVLFIHWIEHYCCHLLSFICFFIILCIL